LTLKRAGFPRLDQTTTSSAMTDVTRCSLSPERVLEDEYRDQRRRKMYIGGGLLVLILIILLIIFLL